MQVPAFPRSPFKNSVANSSRGHGAQISSTRAEKARDRASGDPDWRLALPLWHDARGRKYRGSIVQLRAGTAYEIALPLKGTRTRRAVKVQTWNDQ